jgi:hypothetical protein
MRRRDFIPFAGGAAAAWPLAARAQQSGQMKHLGVLMNETADNPEAQNRFAAFLQGLQEAGWAVGRNLRIDIRWAAGDVDRLRRYAAELVSLAPDLILGQGSSTMRLPYYGGSVLVARSVAGNDFMYWQVMERARERGCKLFDFGRSKRETGSFDFKAHWGFEPEPLCYEYFFVKASQVPDLSPKNPKYERMISLWRKPAAAHAAHWPPVARYLG